MAEIAVYWSQLPVFDSADWQVFLDRLELANIRVESPLPAKTASRARSLAARALLSMVLEARHGLSAEMLRFSKDDRGRPILRSDQKTALPNISISHVRNYVAVAVSDEAAIGIDIEDVTRRANWSEIAKRYFAPDEWQEISSLPRDEGRWRFFEIWTQKEAIGKVSGEGVLPLLKVRVSTVDACEFELIHPDKQTVLALAWQSASGSKAELSYQEVAPSDFA